MNCTIAFTTSPGRPSSARRHHRHHRPRRDRAAAQHALLGPARQRRAVRPSGRDHGRRADIDAADPDVHLLLSLRQRRASISLDLSGDPLFKRLPPAATRAGEGAHVLRPDYAALVLAQVGWTALCERELTADDYENEALPTLIDASCAGGGLLLEAVNILDRPRPGAARERWGFEAGSCTTRPVGAAACRGARARGGSARAPGAHRGRRHRPRRRKTAERMVKCAGYKRFVDFCAAKPATVLDHAGAVARCPPWSRTRPRPRFRSCTMP